MPLYVVKQGEGEALKERLVEANNQASARNFVARETIKVERASQADLFRIARAGGEVEVATGEVEAEGEAQVQTGAETKSDGAEVGTTTQTGAAPKTK